MEDVDAKIAEPTFNDDPYSYRLVLTPEMVTAILNGKAVAFTVNCDEYCFEVVAAQASNANSS